MAIDKSRLSIPHILKTLWLNWMISYGAITLPLLLGIFTPKLWLPFICLAECIFCQHTRTTVSTEDSGPIRCLSR